VEIIWSVILDPLFQVVDIGVGLYGYLGAVTEAELALMVDEKIPNRLCWCFSRFFLACFPLAFFARMRVARQAA